MNIGKARARRNEGKFQTMGVLFSGFRDFESKAAAVGWGLFSFSHPVSVKKQKAW